MLPQRNARLPWRGLVLFLSLGPSSTMAKSSSIFDYQLEIGDGAYYVLYGGYIIAALMLIPFFVLGPLHLFHAPTTTFIPRSRPFCGADSCTTDQNCNCITAIWAQCHRSRRAEHFYMFVALMFACAGGFLWKYVDPNQGDTSQAATSPTETLETPYSVSVLVDLMFARVAGYVLSTHIDASRHSILDARYFHPALTPPRGSPCINLHLTHRVPLSSCLTPIRAVLWTWLWTGRVLGEGVLPLRL